MEGAGEEALKEDREGGGEEQGEEGVSNVVNQKAQGRAGEKWFILQNIAGVIVFSQYHEE